MLFASRRFAVSSTDGSTGGREKRIISERASKQEKSIAVGVIKEGGAALTVSCGVAEKT